MERKTEDSDMETQRLAIRLSTGVVREIQRRAAEKNKWPDDFLRDVLDLPRVQRRLPGRPAKTE